MPRSRWLVLVVAALLLLLGGANRGRVPADEREGSRTGDEPAVRTIRFHATLADEAGDTAAARGDGDGRLTAPPHAGLRASACSIRELARPAGSRGPGRAAGPCSPRGPPAQA